MGFSLLLIFLAWLKLFLFTKAIHFVYNSNGSNNSPYMYVCFTESKIWLIALFCSFVVVVIGPFYFLTHLRIEFSHFAHSVFQLKLCLSTGMLFKCDVYKLNAFSILLCLEYYLLANCNNIFILIGHHEKDCWMVASDRIL